MKLAVLEVQNLEKSFPELENNLPILKNISAQFMQGHSYAIMGSSGAGKSTLIQLLAGLDSPTAGRVLLNGIALDSFSQQQQVVYLQQSIGLLFQLPYLIKELSVIENVMLPALIANKNYDATQKEAAELLKAVELFEKRLNKPGELSGGQQQRVALARALINRPSFLIADEPTGNLDEQTSVSIASLMLELKARWNMGIIVSTHDQYLADQMDQIFVLKNGVILSHS